jgi:hypothetical protein
MDERHNKNSSPADNRTIVLPTPATLYLKMKPTNNSEVDTSKRAWNMRFSSYRKVGRTEKLAKRTMVHKAREKILHPRISTFFI